MEHKDIESLFFTNKGSASLNNACGQDFSGYKVGLAFFCCFRTKKN